MADVIHTVFKKVQDIFRGPPTMSEEEEMLMYFRKEMINFIQLGKDCKDLTTNLVHAKVSSFTKKYALLNVSSLLYMNNQSLTELKQVVTGLSMIVKYAVCLMKAKEFRKKEWNVFPFNDQHVQTKITPLKGYDTILNQLGYTSHCDQGLTFLPNTEPEKEIVANLIVDMILFKGEIKEYLRGNHPQADQLEEFLPEDTIDEVLAFRESLRPQNMRGLPADTDSLSSSDENPFEDSRASDDENSTVNFPNTGTAEALSDKVSQSTYYTATGDAVSSAVASHPASGTSGGQSSGSLPNVCDVCGLEAQLFCRQCPQKPLFCDICSGTFHKHPDRRGHKVEPISDIKNISLESEPSVQIEGRYGIKAQKQNRERIQKFNKSQETEVVKSPSKEKNSSNNNMPALGLLGFNSEGEDIPEQGHHFKMNDPLMGTLDQMQNPGLPSHLDNLRQNYPTNLMHRDNTPIAAGQLLSMQSPHNPYYQGPAGALPFHLLNQSLPRQGGLHHFDGQNSTFERPLTNAQMNYDAAKMRMGHSPHMPQHGPEMGRHMFQYSPEQSHWVPTPQVPISTSYAYNADYQSPRNIPGVLSMMPAQAMPSHGQDIGLHTPYASYYATAGYNKANVPNVSGQRFHQSTYPYSMPPQNNMTSLTAMNFPREVRNAQHEHFGPGAITDPRVSLPTGQFLNSSMNLNQSMGKASMLSSNNFISPKLQQIMSSSDAQHQLRGCENAIQELSVAIQDIQERIDKILLVEEDPTKNSTFAQLSSAKSYCLKEKNCIIKHMKGLKENNSMLQNVETSPSRTIYFPPPLSDTMPQRQNTNMNSSNAHIKKHSEEKSVLIKGLSGQQSNESFDKSESVVSANEGKTFSASWKQTRQPVESSNGIDTPVKPPIPPRQDRKSPELGSVLEKILSPPSPSQLKMESKTLKWYCDYCTFLNETMTSRVCEVCHKTSDNPRMGSPTDNSDGKLDMSSPETFIGGDNDVKDDSLKGWTKNHLPSSTPRKHKKITDPQDQVMKEKKKAQEKYFLEQKGEQQKTKAPNKAVSDLHKKQTPLTLSQSGSGSSLESWAMIEGEETPIPSVKAENAQKALARRREMELYEKLKREGEEVVDLIKAADKKGYKVEAVDIAQIHCKSHNMTPLQWLDENWNKYLEKIMLQVKMVGTVDAENCIGELSMEEAEISFITCHGNVNEAVLLAVENRKELFEYLNSAGSFAREEILQAMHSQKGNSVNAEGELVGLKLSPFLNRVWDSNENSGLSLYHQPECYNSVSTSIISHDDFQREIKCKGVDTERRIRMILVEGKLKSWGRAELVIKILDEYLHDEELSLEDVVDAVRNCRDRESALVYLQQECCICFSTFPMNKIRSLNICQCKICQDCLKTHFEIAIREKHIRSWSCPNCSQPDLSNLDMAHDYLHFLSLLLQPLIDQELMNLFETKLRDLHLQRDPLFRWCAHCASGFLAENPNQLPMTCYYCRKKTCFNCKKQWEEQHENLTCEQFAQWKIQNDPNNQAVGLAKHLEENGIDCPGCKMRFALAKGGCMHFRCPECGHEFCSGCNETYHHSGVCQKYKTCASKGLHCHHPRDCFSYLRDNSVTELQSLLEHHQVAFNVEAPQDQDDVTKCPVMEQKESGTAKKDEKCGKESVQGQAGLCELHYKEYLTGLINGNRLDPLLLMSVDEMKILLGRHELEILPRSNGETEDDYKTKLTKFVEARLPLKRNYV